jgi:hypothetical protein
MQDAAGYRMQDKRLGMVVCLLLTACCSLFTAFTIHECGLGADVGPEPVEVIGE